ncbi:MAG: LacI family DNA-binding transcriptional regulator [Clostridia bacterium]|nr:LacI family DNA-binding transcriptional regulator [Clostridia bacterium]
MKISMLDIAQRAGVSTTTVSRVINNNTKGVSEQTRNRILEIIRETNYRPSIQARNIAQSHSNIIGVIIPDMANLFYPKIIRGINDCITKHGHLMMLCNSDSNPETEKQQLLAMVDNRVAGVVLCSGVSNDSFLKEYHQFGTPLVMIGRNSDSKYADGQITGDNVAGMYESASYILGHGHRDILYIDGPMEVSGPIFRQKGFRHAMADKGMPVDESMVFNGDFSVNYGYRVVSDLLEQGHRFTAVISGSDLIAVGAVKALLHHGVSVPKDVEVIGYDNIDLSEICEPALSTVSKPHYDMAYEAAEILMRIIEGDTPKLRYIKTEAKLILRDTTRGD